MAKAIPVRTPCRLVGRGSKDGVTEHTAATNPNSEPAGSISHHGR